MSEQPQSPLDSPSPPTSPDELNSPFGSPEQERVVSPPVQRMQSDSGVPPSVAGMTASSTSRGQLDAARRPAGATFARGNPPTMNADIAAKMRAFSLARSGPATPQPNRTPSTSGQPAPGGFPSNFRLPPGMNRPTPVPTNSSPAVTGGSKPMSLAEKRGLRLPKT